MGSPRAVATFTLLLCGLPACGSDGGAPADADPDVADAALGALAEVHLIGRFTNDAAPQFAWSGSAIRTRFAGTALSIRLGGAAGNHFEVTVDGVAQPVLITGGGDADHVIAIGLPPGEHDVVVARRTEAFFGATTFLGFSGAPLVETRAPTRMIEMIGDSITCGYGVLGASATCPFSAATEAETHAWGALAAAELGVAHTAIAYSGLGVYRDYSGDLTGTVPARFDRIIADDPTSTWGFTGQVPDVVVVNLGTNDFATGDPGQPFVDAYITFVAELRARYPAAHIIIAMSPMLGDSFPQGAMHRTIARGHLQEVVAAGDDRVTYLELAEQDADDGYGCDYHPSEATQTIMATALVAEIRARTGW